MNDLLVSDLQQQVRATMQEPGSISPSVYDTAVVLRHAPPPSPAPALEWLIEQQASDGGWGPATAPFRVRTAPTLAALLTLNEQRCRAGVSAALARGWAWVWRTAPAWEGAVPDDVSVGVELLVPTLLDAARSQGLEVPGAPFDTLVALGSQRRARIAALRPDQLASTTAAHSWDALGAPADPCLFHPVFGVGGSPAATAVWSREAPDDHRYTQAMDYLGRAATSTHINLPGVVPTAFPMTNFIAAYSLHTLAQVGLLEHPAIAPLVAANLDALGAALTPCGLSFFPGFVPDADDTAALLGAQLAFGRRADLAPLRQFACGDHFATYHHEIQPSLITTARAVQVLDAAGEPVARYQRWIAGRQQRDGRWVSDKWNMFWGYNTWQSILALRSNPAYADALQLAALSILARQFADGGWGVTEATPEATAYAVLALAALPEEQRTGDVARAVAVGRDWLFRDYRPFMVPEERHWIAKEPYCPYRLSRLIVLAAMLSTEESCVLAASA